MRVFSWNTGGRVGRANQQLAAIRERRPDVVCLQEVRRSTVDVLKEGLSAGGLIHALDSLLSEDDAEYESLSRQTGTLIASRWPLHALPGPDIPWSEKALATLVELPAAKIEVHTAHVPPGSSNGWVKIDTFDGIYKRLASNSGVARILCGDFNSPQLETRGGRVITWGEDEVEGQFVCWGKYKGRTGKEWDVGERSVLQGLAEFDLHDVFSWPARLWRRGLQLVPEAKGEGHRAQVRSHLCLSTLQRARMRLPSRASGGKAQRPFAHRSRS